MIDTRQQQYGERMHHFIQQNTISQLKRKHQYSYIVHYISTSHHVFILLNVNKTSPNKRKTGANPSIRQVMTDVMWINFGAGDKSKVSLNNSICIIEIIMARTGFPLSLDIIPASDTTTATTPEAVRVKYNSKERDMSDGISYIRMQQGFNIIWNRHKSSSLDSSIGACFVSHLQPCVSPLSQHMITTTAFGLLSRQKVLYRNTIWLYLVSNPLSRSTNTISYYDIVWIKLNNNNKKAPIAIILNLTHLFSNHLDSMSLSSLHLRTTKLTHL
ncbi:hypothetical protein BC941DRAFT_516596 [Chlamydoabsidia padenii]|nr:hypothetical protein BC941DRAFT_516596 [Chlamydoabsidia padenii]